MDIRLEALRAFTDIVEDGAYSNIRLKQITASKEETAFICALVYAALEHLYWTDYMLSFYVKRQKKIVRNILRLAMAELFFMDSPDYAVVNESVNLCRRIGKNQSCSLVNAVLRSVLRDKDSLPNLPEDTAERLSIQYSFPKKVIEEWITEFGKDSAELMLHRSEPITEIRSQWPFSSDDLQLIYPEAKRGDLVHDCFCLRSGSITPENDLISAGKVVFQSEGAMAICRFMPDLRGKKLLDACSAPGGKSAYLYSICEGDIDITCFELHPHRVELMRSQFLHLGVRASVFEKDASEFDERFAECFDAVLLDVPCSGLGLIHTKPDVGLQKENSDFTDLYEMQKRILEVCSRYVKPGGILLYATCTVSAKENRGQIDSFISRHSDFILEDDRQLLPNIDCSGGYYMARLIKCI